MVAEPSAQYDTSDPDRLYWDEFVARGKELRERADGIQWELGALALTIETTYGLNDLARFAQQIGVAFDALHDYRYVASRFVVRPTNLSFGVLRVLAPRDDREALAERAAVEHWTVKRARDETRPQRDYGPKDRPAKSEVGSLQVTQSKGKHGEAPSEARWFKDIIEDFERLAERMEAVEENPLPYWDHETARAFERAYSLAYEFAQQAERWLNEPPSERRQVEDWGA